MMIDIHTHILWGLDDGARTIDDSLEMCQIAYRDGIRTVVVTPHTLNGIYQNDRPLILDKVRELKAALLHSEIRNPNSPIRILPGADVHLCEETLRQLEGGEVTTLGDGGKYLLIEFPFPAIPYGAEEMLFQVMTRGIIPIISHPERNLEIKQSPRRYHEMIQMGCLGQVTAMSLTGGFGPAIKRHAEKLLAKRLVHLIASDAHSTDGRPPILSNGVFAAEKIVGREEALRMVTEYPQAILEGRRPDIQLMHKG